MKELNFNDTVRLAENMLQQNLGSNQFQNQLEAQLLDLFPHDISTSHLVALCKCTSRHRFQQNALLNKIQDVSINHLPNMTNQQILMVLWSFSRAARGSSTIYSLLEKQVLHRINMYNLRAIAFIIEGFSLNHYKSSILIDAISKRFFFLINTHINHLNNLKNNHQVTNEDDDNNNN